MLDLNMPGEPTLPAIPRFLEAAPGVAVVVLTMETDPAFGARFERECRIAASIEHPHVVPVFHAGREGERLYVTMRYIAGTGLRALLAKDPAERSQTAGEPAREAQTAPGG